jgi:hypothetical protein
MPRETVDNRYTTHRDARQRETRKPLNQRQKELGVKDAPDQPYTYENGTPYVPPTV